MSRRHTRALSAFVVAVAAAIVSPTPAVAHESAYCQHSEIFGDYWGLRYDGYMNEYYSDRSYYHYHYVWHMQNIAPPKGGHDEYHLKHEYIHYCGTGTVRNGKTIRELDMLGSVEVHPDIGVDPLGNVPVP